MSERRQQPQQDRSRQRIGLPDDLEIYSPFPFKGMNTKGSAIAIDDHEFARILNFVKLGNGNLFTLPSNNPNPVYVVRVTAATNAASGAGSNTLSFASAALLTNVVIGMAAADLTTSGVIPAGTTVSNIVGTTVTLSQNITGGGVNSGDTIQFGHASGVTIINYQFVHCQSFGADVGVVFLSDGTAVSFRLDNFHVIAISTTANLLWTSGESLPCVTGWGAKWALIGTWNAYYVWDMVNSVFFAPGTLGPETNITNGGGPYTSAPTVTVSGGSGSGATVTAQLDPGGSGAVTELTVTSGGTGYKSTDIVTLQFTGGGLSNATATGTVTIGTGGVSSIQVINGGTGYSNEPTVTISGGGGSGATAVALGQANSITEILVVTPGTGYTSTPTVSVGAPAGGGATCTAEASLQYNSITAINITTGGSGYVTTPDVVVVDPDGSGSGFVGVAVMSGGAVASVQIINGGQGYSNETYVTFVGGNPQVAAATISLMPQGGQNPISASSIAVFLQQVWMVNGTYEFVSVPGTVTSFAASNGGLIQQDTDSFLASSLTAVAPSGAFLYKFGDQSVNAVSSVTVSSSAGSTTASTAKITDTNIDPQIGTLWPETVQPFDNSLIFANMTGVYAVYGSSVTKVSDALDGMFYNLQSQAIAPTAAVVNIFGIRYYAVVLRVSDANQLLGPNTYIFLWDGKEWFASNQVAAITQIAGRALNGYGSDGSNIYPLYTTPSTSLTKTLVSKWYGADTAYIFKQALRAYLSFDSAVTVTVTMHTENGDLVIGSITYPGAAGPASKTGYGTQTTVLGFDAQGAEGRFLGFTLTITAAAAALNHAILGWRKHSGYYS